MYILLSCYVRRYNRRVWNGVDKKRGKNINSQARKGAPGDGQYII